MAGELHDAAHVDADRRQDSSCALLLAESHLGFSAVRDAKGAYDVPDSPSPRNLRDQLRFHRAPIVRDDLARRGVRVSTAVDVRRGDRKSTRLNSSHVKISYAVFCLKKKNCQ